MGWGLRHVLNGNSMSHSSYSAPCYFFDLEYDHTGIRGPNGSRRLDYSNSKSNLLVALSGIYLFEQVFNSEYEGKLKNKFEFQKMKN